MSTNNGGHYQDIQKSVRAGSPNGYLVSHLEQAQARDLSPALGWEVHFLSCTLF